jgi:hypothetical protein
MPSWLAVLATSGVVLAYLLHLLRSSPLCCEPSRRTARPRSSGSIPAPQESRPG